MSDTSWAGSPTEDHLPVDSIDGDGAHDGVDHHGVSGAIERAVRRSSSDEERESLLPRTGQRLRTDRARALLDRDHAIQRAQELQNELAQVHLELKIALAHAEDVESTRDDVVIELRRVHQRADELHRLS